MHLKILMIGNSFSKSVTKQLPQLVSSSGHSMKLCSLYIGGCPLRRHVANVLESAADAEARQYDVDVHETGAEVLSCRGSVNELVGQDAWDIVTIQQASQECWDYANYQPFADQLIGYVRRRCPGAELVIQETWAYNAVAPRLKAWGFGQRGMHERLVAAYGMLAAVTGFRVIPTGDAVQIFRERHSGLPDPVNGIEGGDTIHLTNPAGCYLQACVWLAKLFGVNPSESGYVPDTLPIEHAAALQNAAWEAVRRSRWR